MYGSLVIYPRSAVPPNLLWLLALVFFEGRRNFHGFDLMSVVIEAENISKRFFLGERNQRAFF